MGHFTHRRTFTISMQSAGHRGVSPPALTVPLRGPRIGVAAPVRRLPPAPEPVAADVQPVNDHGCTNPLAGDAVHQTRGRSAWRCVMGFADLHRRGGAPFVLPNAWDVPSALAYVAAGFTAVGTTSFGVSSSHGHRDGGRATRDAHVALARALAPLDFY